ncbi:N-acetylglucosamine-6-phosphate deacetylase [Nonomuraea lactucae]|uniref:N-acetylglucosamine-6-phosphate deacetylase n=1 Tax=Nonomuraea lactucae TaxID=2249762 RepID=UPI000DE2FB9F|nr:N-acetylglucosamine-6-phosphate deacetylase [Nonomuraea lactucae]
MSGHFRHSIVNATVVTPGRILHNATLVLAGEVIEDVGHLPPAGPVSDVAGAWVLPGFIDVHAHGGGGRSFTTGDPAEIDEAAAFHLAHGTTRLLASLASVSVADIVTALDAISRCGTRREGRILGAHLEGPFLSHRHPGCHDLHHLIPPDVAVLQRLLGTAPGLVRTLTLAPELPGAVPVIEAALAGGVRLGIGHSAATYEEALSAFDRGIGHVTHVHNAMPALGHRAPGIFGAAVRRGIPLELIADGVHVHPTVVAMTFRLAPGRVALITDAAPATGMPAGHLSHVGSAAVVTRPDGRITRRDGDTLAGSALTMDEALRQSLSAGVPLLQAVRAAATTPAELLGEGDRFGSIARGKRADLVIMDESFQVRDVLVDGRSLGRTPRSASLAGTAERDIEGRGGR